MTKTSHLLSIADFLSVAGLCPPLKGLAMGAGFAQPKPEGAAT